LNLNSPVAQGMSGPLIKDLVTGAVHGETGLDNIVFPEHNKKPDKKNAVQFIIDSCLENDKITLITIGPLTNIAMAIKLEPKIRDHIELISMMGGSIGVGNMNPAAEYNVLADPESAHIVFSSGIKIKMNGLDVTNLTVPNEKIIERFEKIESKSAKLFVDCMKNLSFFMTKYFNKKYGCLHDAVPVLALIDDSIIKYKKAVVEVDLSHGISYGRTNCDLFAKNVNESNVEVAVEIDIKKFWDLIEEIYKKY
jgi:ribosylpyrimidine nucleosidase